MKMLVTKLAMFALLLSPVLAFTQNPPTNVPSFTLNFNVLNGPLSGAGTDIAGTYGVTSAFTLRQDTMIFPSVNGQFFAGGVQYALPTCSLLWNTNLNCGKFQFYVTGSGGVARRQVGSASATTAGGGMFGGGANYDPLGTGKFTINLIDFHYARMPGLDTGWTPMAAIGFNLGFGTNGAALASKVEAVRRAQAKKLKRMQEKAAKAAAHKQ